MGSRRSNRCSRLPPEPEVVTLIIPQFLQNALGCFNSEADADISHLHKISLVSPLQQSLYVNNEQDLKDALRQYCLYKQLCEKVDGEMKMLNLEFQLSDNSIRLVRSAKVAKSEEAGAVPAAQVAAQIAAPAVTQETVRPATAPEASSKLILARTGSAPCPGSRCPQRLANRPGSAAMRSNRMHHEKRDQEDSGCCIIL